LPAWNTWQSCVVPLDELPPLYLVFLFICCLLIILLLPYIMANKEYQNG